MIDSRKSETAEIFLLSQFIAGNFFNRTIYELSLALSAALTLHFQQWCVTIKECLIELDNRGELIVGRCRFYREQREIREIPRECGAPQYARINSS